MPRNFEEILKSDSFEELEQFLAEQAASQEDLAAWLRSAVIRGNRLAVKVLLARGADPKRIPSRSGPRWTALHVAVENQAVDLIRLLVAHGGDVNQPDDAGMTPLHLAVDVEADGARQLGESPDVETTRLLLELGADPDAADQRGKTPRTLAEEYAHEGALSLMARRNGPS